MGYFSNQEYPVFIFNTLRNNFIHLSNVFLSILKFILSVEKALWYSTDIRKELKPMRIFSFWILNRTSVDGKCLFRIRSFFLSQRHSSERENTHVDNQSRTSDFCLSGSTGRSFWWCEFFPGYRLEDRANRTKRKWENNFPTPSFRRIWIPREDL